MYQRFYDLRELPFELTPNPKYLFLTPSHREALSNLRYAVGSRKPLTILLGEAGTGKSTLLRAAVESEECQHVTWVFLNNPVLTRADFIRTLAMRFALGVEAETSKSVFLDTLECELLERRARGEVAVLVVDEAQSLSNELLEEIRLLANIETTTQKLLLLVLAGQPELAAKLNEPELRQLKQRVALRCEIAPFDLAETAAYIASRIAVAGGSASPLFTREAVDVIHEYSGGIPRMINVICDNALAGGLAAGRHLVDRGIVMSVVRDFDLGHGSAGHRLHDVPPSVVHEAADAPVEPRAERPLFAQFAQPRRFAFFGTRR